jgi:hypothetical protein
MRKGRSTLDFIDRLFDENEGIRYEDRVNLEANYNISKLVDKKIETEKI